MVRPGEYKKWSPDSQGLTPCGEEQAAKAAEALKHIRELPPIQKHVTSTVLRAQETGAIIRGELKLEYDAELKEGNLDDDQVLARLERVFNNYFTPNKGERGTEVFVTHANVIRFMLCR